MVKFLTTALGGLTALTVAGLATPSGQAMLGLHQTQPAVPVSVISDPGPAKVALPAATPVSTAPAPETAPAPAVVQHTAVPAPRSEPVAHPAATRPVYHSAASRPAYHPAPAAARPVPAPAGLPMGGAGAGAITNILLNLPQVLQQGGAPGVPQYAPPAPAPDNGGWGQRHRRDRWRHGQGDENRGPGER
jgi:hypothetical protein